MAVEDHETGQVRAVVRDEQNVKMCVIYSGITSSWPLQAIIGIGNVSING